MTENEQHRDILVIDGPDGWTEANYRALHVAHMPLSKVVAPTDYDHVIYWPDPSSFERIAPDSELGVLTQASLLSIAEATKRGTLSVAVIPSTFRSWPANASWAFAWLGPVTVATEEDYKIHISEELQAIHAAPPIQLFAKALLSLRDAVWPITLSLAAHSEGDGSFRGKWSELLSVWLYIVKKKGIALPNYVSRFLKTEVTIVPGHMNGSGEFKSLFYLSGKGYLAVIPEPKTLGSLISILRQLENSGVTSNVREQHELSIANMGDAERAKCRAAKAKVEQKLKKVGKPNPMVGESNAILRLYPNILKAAENPETPILVHGETGSGKEVLFNLLRLLAPPGAPFEVKQLHGGDEQTVHSEIFGHVKGGFTGAIEERPGAIEKVAGGTLVLDNLHIMDGSFSTALLRVLEEKQPYQKLGSDEIKRANCRIILGFSKSPEELLNTGRLPADLPARCPIHIRVPLLNERLEDIPSLVEAFAKQTVEDTLKSSERSKADISKFIPKATAIEKWQNTNWEGASGNVRGLKNRVRDYVEEAIQQWRDEILEEKQLKGINLGRPTGSKFISDADLVSVIEQIMADQQLRSLKRIFDRLTTVAPKMKHSKMGLLKCIRRVDSIDSLGRNIDLNEWKDTTCEAVRNLPDFNKFP